MTHPIRCTCGKLKGTFTPDRNINRCVCYCADCQAFALRVFGMMLKARLSGKYKQNPFFVMESGTPIVTPKVLSAEELQNVKPVV